MCTFALFGTRKPENLPECVGRGREGAGGGSVLLTTILRDRWVYCFHENKGGGKKRKIVSIRDCILNPCVLVPGYRGMEAPAPGHVVEVAAPPTDMKMEHSLINFKVAQYSSLSLLPSLFTPLPKSPPPTFFFGLRFSFTIDACNYPASLFISA